MWVSAGKILGPLLFGALLTFFISEYRAAVDRGRGEGLELRRLGREFLRSASGYAEQRRRAGKPSPQVVHEAAQALALRLEEVKARRTWWRVLTPVLGVLDSQELDTAVVMGWGDLDDRGRRNRYEEVMDVVHRIDAQVARTARALEHPWRPPVFRWLVLRQRVPS